jgi:hypothetical protein
VSRHRFIIVVPVADRPRHIQACLASLCELLRRYPYNREIRVLIADDSADPAQVAANRAVAAQFCAEGLAVIHFGPEEQYTLAAPLQATLPGVVGTAPPDRFGHKGQGVMRNIAWLKVAQLLKDEPDDEVVIWSIDSDQEFCVNLTDGSLDYAIDYFGDLDRLFADTDALVATGKVVGDPPVSPAVMTASFLADVDAFIEQMAKLDPQAACSHHGGERNAGDAAYHDMADLFGFQPATHYAYPCPLEGPHSEADCYAHFAARVNSFFYGEHPTRVSCYEPAELLATVKPARTVYAGNYMFRPAALAWFIPFAQLRLRMSGPTLGRILRAELGPRFVSANLPMLHKRTVDSGGQSEFRPGIETQSAAIDMSGEFERQFYGDVTLFAVEKLTADGPLRRTATADFLAGGFAAAIDATRAEMLERYNARQQAILARLAVLEGRLAAPDAWWHAEAAQAATERFRDFCANVRRNFGSHSSGHALINDDARWQRWRADLITALERQGDERDAWQRALCAR